MVTAVAIPYALAARDQLGLSTDDEDAVRSAVCLDRLLRGAWSSTGTRAQLTISAPATSTRAQFLLTYGSDRRCSPTST